MGPQRRPCTAARHATPGDCMQGHLAATQHRPASHTCTKRTAQGREQAARPPGPAQQTSKRSKRTGGQKNTCGSGSARWNLFFSPCTAATRLLKQGQPLPAGRRAARKAAAVTRSQPWLLQQPSWQQHWRRLHSSILPCSSPALQQPCTAHPLQTHPPPTPSTHPASSPPAAARGRHACAAPGSPGS